MIKVGTLLALSILSLSAYAATTGLNSPAPGVLCDKTICADEHGLSVELTTKYLGKQQGEKLAAAGQFDTSALHSAVACFVTPTNVCVGMTAISAPTVSAAVK